MKRTLNRPEGSTAKRARPRLVNRLVAASALGVAALILSALVGATAAQATEGVTAIPSSYLPDGIACNWYSGAAGANGPLYGVQCTVTTSIGGGADTTTDEPPPIPLAPTAQTGTPLIYDINTWLSDNNVAASIQATSLVGIEAIGGKGANGSACGACSHGKGGNAGYAISVQSLGGMVAQIQDSGWTSGGNAVPPVLYVWVGAHGESAASKQGGGGGSSTWITGLWPGLVDQNDVLQPDPDLTYAIAGGGGGGGGVYGTSGTGAHGGTGGSMTSTGPNTASDSSVAGTDGSGGSEGGQGGNPDGAGNGGKGYGGQNSGVGGIGGMGGFKAETVGWTGSAFSWPYGHGGSVGGDKATGGGGGGGFGGGGGGGQHESSLGIYTGRGGGGGGTWARQSVSAAAQLPTLYNVNGANFKVSNYFDTAVLSFSLVTATGAPYVGLGPSSTRQCADGGWTTFNDPVFRNQGRCIRYVERHHHKH